MDKWLIKRPRVQSVNSNDLDQPTLSARDVKTELDNHTSSDSEVVIVHKTKSTVPSLVGNNLEKIDSDPSQPILS